VREHPYLLVGGVAGILAIFIVSTLLGLPFWATATMLVAFALLLNVVVRARR